MLRKGREQLLLKKSHKKNVTVTPRKNVTTTPREFGEDPLKGFESVGTLDYEGNNDNPMKEARTLIEGTDPMSSKTILGNNGVVAMHRLASLASIIPKDCEDLVREHAERWMRIIVSHKGVSRSQFLEAFRKAVAEEQNRVAAGSAIPIR